MNPTYPSTNPLVHIFEPCPDGPDDPELTNAAELERTALQLAISSGIDQFVIAFDDDRQLAVCSADMLNTDDIRSRDPRIIVRCEPCGWVEVYETPEA